MRQPGLRRILTILVVAAWVGLAAVGYVLTRQAQDNGSLDRVRTTGVLRVGVDASFPPFESLDEAGNAVGLDIELAQGIAGRLGARAQFVNIAFDGLYDALQAARVDVVISGLPYDERRTRDVVYSQPYFNAGQMLVLRVGEHPGPIREADLPSVLVRRRVAVEWGSTGDMEARELQEGTDGMQVLPQASVQEALEALIAGRADAVIGDAVSVHQFMGTHPDAVQVSLSLTEEPHVVATSVRSRRLAAAIDVALAELEQSGALESLCRRWLQGGH